MRKYLPRLSKSALLAIAAVILSASVVLAVVYRAPLTITENASNTYDMLATGATSNNAWMAANGFMLPSALDTRVETLGGLEHPHMVADNSTWTAVPVPADSQTNLFYTMGNSLLSTLRMIFGVGSYVTEADNTTLELGDNFTLSVSGWIDTSTGADKSLVYKQDAIDVFVSDTVAGNITATVYDARRYWRSYKTDAAVPGSNTMELRVVPEGGGNISVAAGLLSQAGLGGWNPALLVDDNIGTVGFNTDASGVGSYMMIDFGVGSTQHLVEWSYHTNGAACNAVWDIQYSADGTTWTTAYTGLNMLGAAGWHTANWTLPSPPSGENVTATGITSGEHTIKLSANTTDMDFYVDDVLEDTMSLSGGNVSDSDYDWLFLQNDVMPYTNAISLSKVELATGFDDPGAGWNNEADAYDISFTTFALSNAIAPATWSEYLYVNYTAINSSVVQARVAGGGGLADPDSIMEIDIYDGTTWSSAYDGTFTSNVWSFADYAPQTANQTRIRFYNAGGAGGLASVMELWVMRVELHFQPNTMILGTVLPDRSGNAFDGVITWGTNPAGVSANLSSLVAETQPSIGFTDARPTPDILPPIEPSDWFVDPAVGVGESLLTNPMRPFVTIMSDTTDMSERQAWVLLGGVVVLFVLILTASHVRGHYIITGVATAATIGALIALTIWPFWTIVIVILALAGGAVAERSPSL